MICVSARPELIALVIVGQQAKISDRPRGWSPPKPPARLMTPATRVREQEDIVIHHLSLALFRQGSIPKFITDARLRAGRAR
jgi:hypothetical protein